MSLVSADHYHSRDKRRRRPFSLRRDERRGRLRKKHHPYEEWVKMRQKIHEADIKRKTQTKAISDFLRRLMPKTMTTSSKVTSSPEPGLSKPFIVPKIEPKRLQNGRDAGRLLALQRLLKRSYMGPLKKKLFQESDMMVMMI